MAAGLVEIAQTGSDEYVALAGLLALMAAVFLLLARLIRLGFLANFLSHPVISGFITASALLIAAGQLKVILGLRVEVPERREDRTQGGRPFGVTGGVGYTKTKIKDAAGNVDQIPGYSKWVANGTAYYEKAGFKRVAGIRQLHDAAETFEYGYRRMLKTDKDQ